LIFILFFIFLNGISLAEVILALASKYFSVVTKY